VFPQARRLTLKIQRRCQLELQTVEHVVKASFVLTVSHA
jgi:hypothetical protein